MSSVAISSATPLFEGLSFALDLGNLSSREKVEIKTLIQAHFGIIHSVPNKKTSCLVCSDGQIEAKSFKYRASFERTQPILNVKYIRDCIRLKKRLDMHTLALDGKSYPTRPEVNEIQEMKERLPDRITDIMKNVLGLTCLPFTLGQLNTFRKPLYLPYMVHRYYKTLPDPPIDPEAPTKKKNNNGTFSLAQLRIEREKKLQQELEEKSKQITENERVLGEEKKQKLRRLKDAHDKRQEEFKSENERKEKYRQEKLRRLIMEKELKKQEERLRAINILKKLLSTQGTKDAPLIEKKWKNLGKISKLKHPEPLAKEALETYGHLIGEFFKENQPPPKIEDDPKTKSKNTKNQPGPEKPAEPPKPLNFLGIVRKSIGLNADSFELPEEVEIVEEVKKPIISWAGQKIFIGGVKFDDLEALKSAKKDPWGDDQVANTKKERIIVFKEIFSKFGMILEWTENWDEGYAMAVYESKTDAKMVISTLKDFKTRKAYYKELKTKFKEEGKEIINIPLPQYYVRWPKFYQKILESKKNSRKKKQPENPGDPFTDKQVLKSITEANNKADAPVIVPRAHKPKSAEENQQNTPRDGRGRGRGAPRGRGLPNRGGPPQRGRGPPQRGRGPQQRGRGPPQRGRGPPQRGRGPPQRDRGAPPMPAANWEPMPAADWEPMAEPAEW